jgi:hypothetical protein
LDGKLVLVAQLQFGQKVGTILGGKWQTFRELFAMENMGVSGQIQKAKSK